MYVKSFKLVNDGIFQEEGLWYAFAEWVASVPVYL